MSDPHRGIVALLPDLLRYARSLTRDPSVAEDLVHDALVSALRNLDGFNPRRPLRAWLVAIVRNRFLDDTRRERVRRDYAEAEGHGDAGPNASSLPALQEVAVDLRRTEEALALLPDEQREVLHLVAVMGMSYQEAADATGVPAGTVMSRLSRARRKLRARHLPGDEAAVTRLRVVGDPGVAR